VGADLLSAAESDGFVVALLHEGEFASVEDHDDALVRKVEFLFAGSVPVDLADLVERDVAHQQVVLGPTDDLVVLEGLEFVHVVTNRAFHAEALLVGQPADHDLALRHLVDLKLVLLAQLAHADVLAVHGPAEAAYGHHGAILLPAGTGD